MTVIFAICLACLPTGDGAGAAFLKVETAQWSDAPCEDLIPARLRRSLVACVKQRGVAS